MQWRHNVGRTLIGGGEGGAQILDEDAGEGGCDGENYTMIKSLWVFIVK
jgi:hypothetical protein